MYTALQFLCQINFLYSCNASFTIQLCSFIASINVVFFSSTINAQKTKQKEVCVTKTIVNACIGCSHNRYLIPQPFKTDVNCHQGDGGNWTLSLDKQPPGVRLKSVNRLCELNLHILAMCNVYLPPTTLTEVGKHSGTHKQVPCRNL